VVAAAVVGAKVVASVAAAVAAGVAAWQPARDSERLKASHRKADFRFLILRESTAPPCIQISKNRLTISDISCNDTSIGDYCSSLSIDDLIPCMYDTFIEKAREKRENHV
jgi:hypothetical protein